MPRSNCSRLLKVNYYFEYQNELRVFILTSLLEKFYLFKHLIECFFSQSTCIKLCGSSLCNKIYILVEQLAHSQTVSLEVSAEI